MSRVALPCLALVCTYVMVAYVFVLPPFTSARYLATGCVHYQVFVDVTGSNARRSNWDTQADTFVKTLKSCDSIDLMTIDDRTGANQNAADRIGIPVVDPGAPSGQVAVQRAERDAALEKVRATVAGIIGRSSRAERTDILNLFNRLAPEKTDDVRNVLVVFSDGLESAAEGVNLEHACVTETNRAQLIDVARGVVRSTAIRAFDAAIWVVPERSGRPGCNSLVELGPFWDALMRHLTDDATPLALEFGTNPF